MEQKTQNKHSQTKNPPNNCMQMTSKFDFTKLFITNNESSSSSSLRYKLASFINPSSNSGEFSQSRLRAFESSQMILVENYRSTVKATGVKAIFYSRYYTYWNLVDHKSLQYYIADIDFKSDNFQQMKKELANFPPTEVIKKAIDKEVESTIKLTEDEVKVRDSYKVILQDVLKDKNLVASFLQFEESINKQIAIGESKNLTDLYNIINRETLNWSKRILEPDIRRLTKFKECSKLFYKDNKFFIQGVIGLASYHELFEPDTKMISSNVRR